MRGNAFAWRQPAEPAATDSFAMLNGKGWSKCNVTLVPPLLGRWITLQNLDWYPLTVSEASGHEGRRGRVLGGMERLVWVEAACRRSVACCLNSGLVRCPSFPRGCSNICARW